MCARARRRHGGKPMIVGLTGSIAMGKTTAATMLRRLGVPVFDADAAIHRLTRPKGPAIDAIAQRFPGTVTEGILDRRALGAQVFADRARLRDLERLLHPHVARERRAWLDRQRRAGRATVILDIPLLFETGGERACNAVWVVTAPAFLQRQRALRRPGMTAERLGGVLARQTPDAVKRRRADVILPTGLGHRETLRRIVKSLKLLGRRPGKASPRA